MGYIQKNINLKNKIQKGKNNIFNNKKNRIPNIIFSSQSTIIDWLLLLKNYSPKFLYIVKSNDNKNDYFIELSYINILFYGIGIKFLSPSKNDKKFNIENYITEKNQIPIIIFPECTKTNRQAILNIRSNLMDEIYEISRKHQKILMRSEIYINLNNDHNTIDSFGLKSLFNLCRRLYTKIHIYSQDIPSDTFSDEDIQYDINEFKTFNDYLDYNLKKYLMEPNNRYIVNFSYKDHIKFLEYFNQTNSDKQGNYVKKKN